MSDKYGLKTLEVGSSVFIADDLGEFDEIGGYMKVYRRIYYLAIQKHIKVSITKIKGGLNVTRTA